VRGLERGVRHTGLIVRQAGLIIGKWKMRRIMHLEIVLLDMRQAQRAICFRRGLGVGLVAARAFACSDPASAVQRQDIISAGIATCCPVR
jgi:hypothetical protein